MSSILTGFEPKRSNEPRYNPNLGRNPFARWARSHFTVFSIVTVLVFCVLKTVGGMLPYGSLVGNIVLFIVALMAAYFLGFNKNGVGRTIHGMGGALRLALPVFVVGLPMLVFSFLLSGGVAVDRDPFYMAYYILYCFAMCYLQDAVLCGMLANVADVIADDAKVMEKNLVTPCAVWSLFYLLNGVSNGTIAQIFGSLAMSLFLCSVYLRRQNLWAVTIAHALCYCMMAGLSIVSSGGYSVLTGSMDMLTMIVYLVACVALLIPYRKNLEVWAEARKARSQRLGVDTTVKKEKTVIRKGVKQKHNR